MPWNRAGYTGVGVQTGLKRDMHLETEVARERAEMRDSDLLDPDARKE